MDWPNSQELPPNPESRSKNTRQQNGKNMNGNTNVLPPVQAAVVYMKRIQIWSWKGIANLPQMGEIAELRSLATTTLRMRPHRYKAIDLYWIVKITA